MLENNVCIDNTNEENVITKDELELLIYHSSRAKEISNNIFRKAGCVNNKKLINLLNNIQYGNIKNIDAIMEDINAILENNQLVPQENKLFTKKEVELFDR